MFLRIISVATCAAAVVIAPNVNATTTVPDSHSTAGLENRASGEFYIANSTKWNLTFETMRGEFDQVPALSISSWASNPGVYFSIPMTSATASDMTYSFISDDGVSHHFYIWANALGTDVGCTVDGELGGDPSGVATCGVNYFTSPAPQFELNMNTLKSKD